MNKRSDITLLTEIYPAESKASELLFELKHQTSNAVFWKTPSTMPSSSPEKNTCCFVKNIPTYADLKFHNAENHKIKHFPSVKGFAMHLQNVSTAEQYMKEHLGKKVKGNIFRSLRRLEYAFPIRYKRYFGNIKENTYQELMMSLKEMIIQRFKEREERSDTLKSWESIYESGLRLIREKKASLYIIYKGEKPISISLSYHFGSLFFYYITSYDIAYYKFSLGNTMIVKQLEWCLENKIEFIEMGWGDLDYKRRWCNMHYTFENQLLYPRKFHFQKYLALASAAKESLIAFLINHRVNEHLKKVKQFTKRNSVKTSPALFETTLANKKSSKMNGSLISLETHSFLKPYVYSFLYSAKERISDITVYKANAETDVYYILGTNRSLKIFRKMQR